MEERIDWYRKSIEETIQILDSSPEGLSYSEAKSRLLQYGQNRIEEKKKRSPFILFLNQFFDFMIIILILAAIISAFLGEGMDSIAILTIVLLNSVIGFVQEYKAEKAIEKLKAMAEPETLVLRDSVKKSVSVEELVPGDIVFFEAGNVVPADIRLMEAHQLKVNEASLTGESVPVEKFTKTLIEKHLPLGDRKNMLFKGTAITMGRGKGIVVETGIKTELGKIAELLQSEKEDKTPLQKKLTDLGKKLTIAFLFICGMVFLIGLLRGGEPVLLFITAVSLAVAAIPEALPAVITISLAFGARKMVEENALIRRLPAVETLGSITYICTDKTGTLTTNKMQIEEIFWNGRVFKKEEFSVEDGGKEIVFPGFFLKILTISNDASIQENKFIGDPTEIALLQMGMEKGYDKSEIEGKMERIAEIPFDSERKCMTTFHQMENGKVLSITKGAPEIIISKSKKAVLEGKIKEIENPTPFIIANERMAEDGLRVLGFGVREWEKLPDRLEPETVENELIFTGFVGMIDPARDEVYEAVRLCKSAGIRPVMITGDHPLTAKAIARKLRIMDDDTSIITGSKLDALSLQELEEKVREIKVYARVAPEQKLKIVKALQEKGEYVAMTGDGVNDAPSLKKADIGVAMGITGTDVAKEASDMILLDDNFATIVKAIREGRKIYDNILKFIRYILASNVGEVVVIFCAPFFSLPLPLLPIQILWINLVTDGLPGIAFSSEKEEPGIMERPPRNPKENVFSRGLGTSILWSGFFLGSITLLSQWIAIKMNLHWQTIVFNVLCLSQLWHAFAVKSFTHSTFKIGFLSNPFLFYTIMGTFLLQIGTIYIPFFNKIFKTSPLSILELLIMLVFSTLLFFAVELEKLIRRKRKS
ncbi:MAG: calcium-translocating P-type ATPase, PMCA-type [Candidatus Aminicenantia bacterium]